MILVRDLHVSVGRFALRGVNLALAEGACLAILGPSGAGKTVLLETVMGARRPDRGQVLVDGRNITDLPPESRRIGYIPQDLALFPHLSVRQNITFGLSRRSPNAGAAEALEQVVRMFDIAHLLDRRDIATLSGGEKQRVALARALVVRPRVLFLDEPLAALDAASRGDLLWSLRAMRRATNTTVFLVTHDLDEACFLADEVAIMMRGRIVEHGPRDRVFRQPRDVAVARFLNIRNILPLSRLRAAGLLPGAATDGGVTHAAIRAEHVRVTPIGQASAGSVPARLEALIPLGSRVVAELALDGSLRLEASLAIEQAAALAGPVPREVAVSIGRDGVIPLSGDDAETSPGEPNRGQS